MLDPFCVLRRISRRDDVIRQETDLVSGCRIETDFLNIAVDIAGRAVEECPLHIPMHPQCAPVTALAFRIYVEDRLNIVITCWQLSEAVNGMPECALVNDARLTGLKTVNINTENRCRVWSNLKARFRRVRTGDDKYYPTGDRARRDGLVIRYFEPRIASRR